MKIYTSYYAKIKKIPENMCLISIAGKCPDFYKGHEYKFLAPKWSFFKIWKETHDNDFYVEHFNKEVLSQLDPDQVVNDFIRLSQGKDVVMLCYEKPSDFCHRHLVADWLTKNGYECKELEV